MNFSAYSIKNPLVAILLFTLLTVGGLLGFRAMKVQQFPDIDLPAVIVTVPLAGASPAQLESDVAKKIENKISSISGVKHIRSTLQTGVATVHTEFVLDKDLQEALDDVRSAMSEVSSDLPAAAKEPVIAKVSTAGFRPVVAYSLASKTKNAAQLSWFIDDTISKRLSNIDGVGTISRIGGIERQIVVNPDVDKLNAWRLPISTLAKQIFANASDATGGEAQIGGGAQTIRILGAVDGVSALQDLQITTPAGSTRLQQLAKVQDAQADISSSATLDGRSVVAFSVSRARGASDVTVANEVDAAVRDLAAQYDDLLIEQIYDNALPIEQDYQASIQMLIEGCVLAVLVVLIFLRDWRATLVAAAALPLSIIPTFLLMHWFGFSLNIISLLALSLVIGVLVDDAIVEVENIMRHLQMGKTPFEAAMEAADEIGLAVIATTFTLIAVFLPTAFMDGVVGQFFQQFGWTAAIAVFISLLVARLVTPMMAAYILTTKPHKPKPSGVLMRGYLRLVHWTLKHRALTMAMMLAVFVGSVSLAGLLPSAFIPPDDSDQTQVMLEMTADARVMDTDRIAQLAARTIQDIQGVRSVFVAIGAKSSGGDSRNTQAGAQNMATLNIALMPRGSRETKEQLEQRIREALQAVPSARFTVGLSATGDSGYNFSLVSSDAALLERTVRQVMSEIRTLPAVASVSSNLPLPKSELAVTPKPAMMAQRGVLASDIASTLRVATSGDYDQFLPKVNLDTRQIPIVVRLSDADRADLDKLGSLYVPSATGNTPLSQVANLQMSAGDAQIRRLDRERAVKISVQSDAQLGALVAAVKDLPSLQWLPDGIAMVDEGQAGEMADLFVGFMIAMGVGVFCIFGVLVLLFHKVLQPLTILIALPLSIGGAFIGLLVTGSSLSMPSMIGFIMLMGIATKNSILLVDYAIIAEKSGMARTAAVLDACQKRARPIIMTTIAMGAGMLPLVLGLSGADPTFRQPMAAAVLGGLATSTFLSLVIIPVFYTLMEDVSVWARRVRAA